MSSLTDCPCGHPHDEITHEQVVSAEFQKPNTIKERDPFPELPGNSTVDFSTRWYRSGVFIADEAAALCASPEELNRAEVKAEGELLRHVKAGLRAAGLQIPEWAQGLLKSDEQGNGKAEHPRKSGAARRG